MLNAIAPPATPPARWRLVGALAMALTLAWAWLSTRAYVGIMHDTPYYALLALARLSPQSLGTDVFLAVNANSTVLRIDGHYHACHNAVWYDSSSPFGP